MPKSAKADDFSSSEETSGVRRKFNHERPSNEIPEYTSAYLSSMTIEELYHARNGAKRRCLAVSSISRRARKDLRKIDAEIKCRRSGPIITAPTGPPPPPNPPKS